MVTAAHPLAAEAGRDMLRDGGNAVDAAVTAAFVLNVVEPFASGIGGGGFMVIYLAEKRMVTVINFRERAPAGAIPDMFLEEGTVRRDWKQTSGLAVAVPGALAGWDYALKKYGTKNLSNVTKKAVSISEEGFPVSATFSLINKDECEKLLANAGENTCYLYQGFPFEKQDVLKNPDLARTIRLIALKGTDVFYKGEIAEKIVAAVKTKDGLLTKEDLASYQPVEEKPLRGHFMDYDIYTPPLPASGGLHIIQLLGILEKRFESGWHPASPEYIHIFAEALRLLFADRNRWLGDPEHEDIPMQTLMSPDYLQRIAERIHPERVLGSYPSTLIEDGRHKKTSTTHLCVVDTWGNIVSLTQSINHFFGSGIVPEGTGFLLNNHMDDFSPFPASPNAPRPGRRPLSSMAPLILFKKGEPFLALGSPGGTRIFSSLTQIIMNITFFGKTLDEAIEAPRFFSYSSGGSAFPLFLESRFPAEVFKFLEKKGHEVKIRGAYDNYFGGAQGIMLLRKGKGLHGGADSRRDGSGAGY